MFNKHILYFILSFFINVCLYSQKVDPEIFRADTKEIYMPYDTAWAVTKINIFPSFVEWRFYPDWDYDRKSFRKIDSTYLKRKNSNDSTYGTVPVMESFYSKKLNAQINSMLLKFKIEKNKIRLNINDSLFLVRELKRVKSPLNHFVLNEYTMSDSLYNFFSKFPAQHHIIYDLLTIFRNFRSSGALDLYGLQRVFVFDVRNKKLIYYQYDEFAICGATEEYWLPVLHDRWAFPYPLLYTDFPQPKRIFSDYISDLKQNEKYLKKIGKITKE